MHAEDMDEWWLERDANSNGRGDGLNPTGPLLIPEGNGWGAGDTPEWTDYPIGYWAANGHWWYNVGLDITKE